MAINLTLQNAIIFATRKHINQKRKGNGLPYIVHPMEVMHILTSLGCDTDVIIAGILHDTLEDTDATPEEIEKMFGKKVLDIVQSESEDKSKTWKERKQTTIDNLKNESEAECLVCLADKLSNIRSMVNDKMTNDNIPWDKFKASKTEIEWYYNSIYNELKNLLPAYTADIMQEFREAIDFCFS